MYTRTIGKYGNSEWVHRESQQRIEAKIQAFFQKSETKNSLLAHVYSWKAQEASSGWKKMT